MEAFALPGVERPSPRKRESYKLAAVRVDVGNDPQLVLGLGRLSFEVFDAAA
jgi:hypothetical protein